jgi:hypothetical protein
MATRMGMAFSILFVVTSFATAFCYPLSHGSIRGEVFLVQASRRAAQEFQI